MSWLELLKKQKPQEPHATKPTKPPRRRRDGESTKPWLARLKNENPPETDATKATKPCQDPTAGGFVGFVAYLPGGFQKIEGAAEDPEPPASTAPPDPDRYAWPHSSAMTMAEIETFVARQRLFERRGFTPSEAERLADELVLRDRDQDDRRCCMECRHLHGDGAYRCGNASKADVRARLAPGFELILRRCLGFSYADQ